MEYLFLLAEELDNSGCHLAIADCWLGSKTLQLWEGLVKISIT